MSGLDLVLAAIVLIGLWRGFAAGAMRTAMSLVSWLIALFVATKFARQFAYLFVDVAEAPILQTALAFLAVFLAVIAVLQLIVYLINKMLSAVKLSWLDKLAGGVLGAGVGLLKVLVILSFTAPMLANFEVWHRSPLTQAIVPYAPLAKSLLSDMADSVYDEFEKELDLQNPIN